MKDLYYFDNNGSVKLCGTKVIRTKVAAKSCYIDRNRIDKKAADKRFTKEEWDDFVSFITQNS